MAPGAGVERDGAASTRQPRPQTPHLGRAEVPAANSDRVERGAVRQGHPRVGVHSGVHQGVGEADHVAQARGVLQPRQGRLRAQVDSGVGQASAGELGGGVRCAGCRDRRRLRSQQIANMRARIRSAKLWVMRVGSRRSGIRRASRSAIPRRRSANYSSMTPPSDVRRPPSKAAVTFFCPTAGKSKDGTVPSTMAGVAMCEVDRAWCQHLNPESNQRVKLRSLPLQRRLSE